MISYKDLKRMDYELQVMSRHFMDKPEIIKINASCSFMARARCKNCGNGPSFYYKIRNRYLYQDHSSYKYFSKYLKAWVNSMASNWYLKSDPKYFHSVSDFSFTVDDKQFRPTLHRSRGRDNNKDNVTEILSCDCGSTVWHFNQKSSKNCPEITNRKSKYKYPKKFEV